MTFRTKLDFSSNRQVKQHEATITILSGGTSFGLTFSALTSGPDLTTSGVSETYTSVASTFSGNTGTTNYTWYDTRMSLGASYLSAITPSNSATTQNTGKIYTPNTTTVIDGNIVNLSYSGVEFDIIGIAMVGLGGGAYSGTILTTTLNILSANTLDFTGRTIWNDVSGITRTERLIVTNNPQVGYVLKCVDSEGMAEWVIDNSGTTVSAVWTAGTGTYSAVLGGSAGVASGYTSISAGLGTEAWGNYSYAEGFFTTAEGARSHAEGNLTTAYGGSSHSEGENTYATGATSHAEGQSTVAAGTTSHAEGNTTTASGSNSHSEGNSTKAIGDRSHAEGSHTISSGEASHAEGNTTTASGSNSHSEGNSTKAIGDRSHAEGYGTTANGNNSHAGGYITIATGDNSFVHGTLSFANGSSVIVLGNNITGTTANTTYVADLVIDGLTSTDPIATDSNGKIVAGVSDARLKQNVNVLTNSLNIINNLRGVSFEYTEASEMGDGIRYGFIAQEVKEFVPDIVRLRAKGNGMYNLNYNEIVPILVEAVKELSQGVTTSNNTHLETQTILAEDNNIDLNYSGNQQTALGGGLTVLHAKGQNLSAEIITDENGDWTTNNDFKAKFLTIPLYTPTSSDDNNGNEGNLTRDNDYLYLKTESGWKRTNLESF